MKPPYTVTPEITNYVVLISERIGTIRAIHLYKPPTELWKKHRIQTIQSSLEIEGNTLTEERVTALMDGKRVIAPGKDILEVRNAIAVYQELIKKGLFASLQKHFSSYGEQGFEMGSIPRITRQTRRQARNYVAVFERLTVNKAQRTLREFVFELEDIIKFVQRVLVQTD